MIYMGSFGILLFLSIRIFHIYKYKKSPVVDVLLNKKYCKDSIKGHFPIHSYPDDNLCLVKGAFISPGILKDRFYLPRLYKQNISLNNKYIESFY